MIDLTQARDLLRRAMETQGPDFIYNPGGKGVCSYSPQPNAPEPAQRITGCLIGVALAIAGETRQLEYPTNGIAAVEWTFPDMMSTQAVRYFWRAQQVQDMGDSWGNAFRAAETLAVKLIALGEWHDAEQ